MPPLAHFDLASGRGCAECYPIVDETFDGITLSIVTFAMSNPEQAGSIVAPSAVSPSMSGYFALLGSESPVVLTLRIVHQFEIWRG